MYQQFTDRIQAIEAEIARTEGRIQINLTNLERQKSTMDQLEGRLLKAQKLCVQDNNTYHVAVVNAEKYVTKAKEDFENFQILDKGLKDKKADLELEMQSVMAALKQAKTKA